VKCFETTVKEINLNNHSSAPRVLWIYTYTFISIFYFDTCQTSRTSPLLWRQRQNLFLFVFDKRKIFSVYTSKSPFRSTNFCRAKKNTKKNQWNQWIGNCFSGFCFFDVFIVLEQRVEDQDLFEKTLVGSSRCSHIRHSLLYSWQLKGLCQRR
jgi:hypothetical protein